MKIKTEGCRELCQLWANGFSFLGHFIPYLDFENIKIRAASLS